MQTTDVADVVAERFVRERGEWYDLATAERVVLHVRRAGPPAEQLAWVEQCEILAGVRHPLLQPLIDFGAADATSLFEAYAACAPVETSRARACTLMTHAVRFLDAHGIVLTRDLADRVFRPIRVGLPPRGHPIGIVLQQRRAVDAVAELLEAGSRCGITAIDIAGPAGSGLRTLRIRVARLARLGGYVPVCAEALAAWPAVRAALAGRHLCMFQGPGQRGPAVRARLLAQLGVESTRSHLRIGLHACGDPPPGALRLDPMGVAAMSAMIHIDRDFGPEPREILDAARAAGGWPGRLLTACGAVSFESGAAPPLAVHESPGPFEVPPPQDGDEALAGHPDHAKDNGVECAARIRVRRVATALAGAGDRAARLAACGRHAAAVRLLRRAATVQAGRGLGAAAADAWLRLTWILRDRGDLDAATAAAARAREVAPQPHADIAAALALGVCWTDACRFVEAEAALRTALVAAGEITDRAGLEDCALALARVLFWRHRMDEALAVLRTAADSPAPWSRCRASALSARIYASSGELPAAIRAGRDALEAGFGSGGPRAALVAHRAMAEAMFVAGDLPGVREHVECGLALSREAHVPLAAVRLRAILLRALATHCGQETSVRALAARLSRTMGGRCVPPIVRGAVASALEVAGAARSSPRTASAAAASTPIEDFLVIAHRAADDRGAVNQIAAAVLERLEAASALVLAGGPREPRVLATAGRPWRGESRAALRALASGLPVPPDRGQQPCESAAPVRHADEVVAAIACRWTIGTVVEERSVSPILRAAALAIAPGVRGLLEASAAEPPPSSTWGELLGESAAAAALREAVLRAARAPFPVLVEGESGSGKELVARAIHRLGPRRDRRFCAINCAAISDELVEAELFGHARGAFTGAAVERPGLFEEADGGTLFLDEIGELAPRAQAKLLRVLQDGEVRRVGENLPRRVDVRIVAATNRHLAEEAAAGRFRADLRFRLDVIRVSVPPLRDRVADIPLLAAHFWQQASARVGSRAALGADALAALSRYDWPGNVRELQNAIAWMAVHAPRRGRVGTALLPAQLASAAPLATGSFEAAREDFERRFVRAALARAGGQRTRAAEVLGVSRQGLAKMLRRLGIDGEERAEITKNSKRG